MTIYEHIGQSLRQAKSHPQTASWLQQRGATQQFVTAKLEALEQTISGKDLITLDRRALYAMGQHNFFFSPQSSHLLHSAAQECFDLFIEYSDADRKRYDQYHTDLVEVSCERRGLAISSDGSGGILAREVILLKAPHFENPFRRIASRVDKVDISGPGYLISGYPDLDEEMENQFSSLLTHKPSHMRQALAYVDHVAAHHHRKVSENDRAAAAVKFLHTASAAIETARAEQHSDALIEEDFPNSLRTFLDTFAALALFRSTDVHFLPERKRAQVFRPGGTAQKKKESRVYSVTTARLGEDASLVVENASPSSATPWDWLKGFRRSKAEEGTSRFHQREHYRSPHSRMLKSGKVVWVRGCRAGRPKPSATKVSTV